MRKVKVHVKVFKHWEHTRAKCRIVKFPPIDCWGKRVKLCVEEEEEEHVPEGPSGPLSYKSVTCAIQRIPLS
jgi:hypothetical protein